MTNKQMHQRYFVLFDEAAELVGKARRMGDAAERDEIYSLLKPIDKERFELLEAMYPDDKGENHD